MTDDFAIPFGTKHGMLYKSVSRFSAFVSALRTRWAALRRRVVPPTAHVTADRSETETPKVSATGTEKVAADGQPASPSASQSASQPHWALYGRGESASLALFRFLFLLFFTDSTYLVEHTGSRKNSRL